MTKRTPGATPSRATFGDRVRKHGHAHPASLTYKSWLAMRNRCLNPHSRGFSDYGAAGVTIDPSWDDFTIFLRDVGERPTRDHTLDRIECAKGYGPGNCRWATFSEQRRNQRRNKAVVRGDGTRFRTLIDAEEATPGSYRRSIRDCCIGRQKTHLGLTWRYA